MNKTLFKILITLLIICSLPFGKGWGWATLAQNLVPNPSFEDIDSCYTFWTIDDWYAPTTGTADFYPGCMNALYPWSGTGYQYARSGNSYAGIITYENSLDSLINNSREYIQTKLVTPLQAGVKYKVTFYANLADIYPNKATNMLGAFLSVNAITSSTWAPLNYFSQIVETAVITDTLNWIEISGNYTALGGEEYITIGCFVDDNALTVIQVNDSASTSGLSAYYYIDDVSIINVNDTNIIITDSNTTNITIPNIITPNGDGINDIFQLNFHYENVLICNRWGQQIFKSNNDAFWDGRTTSGNKVPDGTYYYIIVTEEETYKGYLQLLR